MSPASGATRALRAGILGAVILLLAGAAHVLGGGEPPPVGVLVGATAGVALVAAAVTARRLRFVPLLIITGSTQAMLHVLFSVSGPITSCAPAVGAHGGHPGLPACAEPAVSALTTLGTSPMAHGGAAMLIMHVLAMAATVWLLARGEAWVWELLEHAVRAATAEPRLVPAVDAYRMPAHPLRTYAARVLDGPGAPRGPPALLTV